MKAMNLIYSISLL